MADNNSQSTSRPSAPLVQPKPKGSGFTNLQRVLQANVNNRLGQAIGSRLGQQAGQLRSDITGTAQGFQQEAERGDLASQSNVAARQAALEQIRSGMTNVSPEEETKFAKFRAGQYTGPSELDPVKQAQIAGKAQSLGALGQSIRSGDKGALLSSTVGRNIPYAAGKQALDTLLLGQGQNPAQLSQARRATTGLPQEVSKQQDIARQIGQANVAKAKQFAEDTRSLLGVDKSGNVLQTGEGAFNQILTPAQQQQQQYAAAQQAALQQFQQNAAAGQLTPEQRQLVAGTTSPIQTFGVDPNAFLNAQTAPTLSTATSAEDKARLSALGKLSGIPTTNIPIDLSAGQYDPNNPYSVDQQAFQQAVQGRRNVYETALKSPTMLTTPYGSGMVQQGIPAEIDRQRAMFESANVGLYGDAKKAWVQQQLQPLYDALTKFQNQYQANKYV